MSKRFGSKNNTKSQNNELTKVQLQCISAVNTVIPNLTEQEVQEICVEAKWNLTDLQNILVDKIDYERPENDWSEVSKKVDKAVPIVNNHGKKEYNHTDKKTERKPYVKSTDGTTTTTTTTGGDDTKKKYERKTDGKSVDGKYVKSERYTKNGEKSEYTKKENKKDKKPAVPSTTWAQIVTRGPTEAEVAATEEKKDADVIVDVVAAGDSAATEEKPVVVKKTRAKKDTSLSAPVPSATSSVEDTKVVEEVKVVAVPVVVEEVKPVVVEEVKIAAPAKPVVPTSPVLVFKNNAVNPEVLNAFSFGRPVVTATPVAAPVVAAPPVVVATPVAPVVAPVEPIVASTTTASTTTQTQHDVNNMHMDASHMDQELVYDEGFADDYNPYYSNMYQQRNMYQPRNPRQQMVPQQQQQQQQQQYRMKMNNNYSGYTNNNMPQQVQQPRPQHGNIAGDEERKRIQQSKNSPTSGPMQPQQQQYQQQQHQHNNMPPPEAYRQPRTYYQQKPNAYKQQVPPPQMSNNTPYGNMPNNKIKPQPYYNQYNNNMYYQPQAYPQYGRNYNPYFASYDQQMNMDEYNNTNTDVQQDGAEPQMYDWNEKEKKDTRRYEQQQPQHNMQYYGYANYRPSM